MQSRASRVARGWMAGSFATGVAALSHGLADGGAPSPLAILAALVFAGVLGTFAIGRRPSLPRLTIVVAGSQLAFHLVFSWLTPGTASGGEHHGTAALLAPAVAHHGDDPAMWIAHGVALLATLLFLRKAELALWAMLRDALRVVARLSPAIAARPPVWRTVAAVAPRHPAPRRFLTVLSRRGPPLPAGA
jgi:hypothetical protein